MSALLAYNTMFNPSFGGNKNIIMTVGNNPGGKTTVCIKDITFAMQHLIGHQHNLYTCVFRTCRLFRTPPPKKLQGNIFFIYLIRPQNKLMSL